jgi:hypothetical protein
LNTIGDNIISPGKNKTMNVMSVSMASFMILYTHH